ncbi:MAG: nucleotidyl transferase AbiEii/AbiGii toxin family protein [Deltaproteobacteria bacterium]|nr:nucleotidyl transferase AbiEii/AbiGii toxin family protein [Deltaproteobacteria bacterium]
MRLLSELKKVAEELQPYRGQWAVCGGVAASIYREKARFTDDIDIALIDSPLVAAKDLSIRIISGMGYKEYFGFVPCPQDATGQLLALVCARDQTDERFAGIDFLLPVQPWIEDGVKIAQSNEIDYGFARLPTVTPESLIVAKLTAISTTPERYQDLDDITEILKSTPIDRAYLKSSIERYQIDLPRELLTLITERK